MPGKLSEKAAGGISERILERISEKNPGEIYETILAGFSDGIHDRPKPTMENFRRCS